MTTWRKRKQPSPRYTVVMLMVSAVATVASLGTVLRVYAMPVEARTTAPWYSYQSSVGFHYVVKVQKGNYYESNQVTPDQLIGDRLPVEPPAYRRVVIAKLADSIVVTVPYKFVADRPANLTGKLSISGMRVMPNFWQKPYPIMQDKEFHVQGSELSGEETFTIPIQPLLGEMEAMKTGLGVAVEPYEVHIHPKFQVTAEGLQEPVVVSADQDFVISVRSTSIEIDDNKDLTTDKAFAETKVVPITMPVFGQHVQVAVLRQISIYALAVFGLLALAMLWVRRKKPDGRAVLTRLGPNLITVRAFEMPGDIAIADVRTAKELVQIHAQTERPVIKVGSTYYLLDGTTCYRYVHTGDEPAGADD